MSETSPTTQPRRRVHMRHGAWPRGLNLELAAAYRGVAPNTFRAEVEAGLWPPPETRGGRKIFDRHAIDRAWDHRNGNETKNGPDPFMEALDDSEA